MKSVEEINEQHRAAGWGKVAEYFGHQPYYVDDKASGAYQEVYDKIMEPGGTEALSLAIKGKRIRTIFLNDTHYGPEEVHDHRDNIIALRNDALKHGAMEWALVLSITVALLGTLSEMLNGDIMVRDGVEFETARRTGADG